MTCPYGLAKVSNEERAVAAKILRERSNLLISGNAASNLAYQVLIALRKAHFDWHRQEAGKP